MISEDSQDDRGLRSEEEKEVRKGGRISRRCLEDFKMMLRIRSKANLLYALDPGSK